MRNVRLLFVAVAVSSGALGLSESVLAQSGGLPEPTLQERLESLEQKQRILERRLELEQEKALEKAKDTPILGAGKEGFFLKSADGSFQLKLRGLIQTDGRFFIDDQEQPGTNSFRIRRARPILEGTVFRHFDFRLMTDFGEGQTVLQDAYLDFRYWPQVRLRAGKFKSPVGLERLQSATDLLFIERAFPTSLIPNRDVGVQLHGDVWDGAVTYAVGVFNGVPDGGSSDFDNHDEKDYEARLFAHPFKHTEVALWQGLGLGVAGTWGNQEGSVSAPNLPSFKTAGQQTFFRYRSDGTAAGTVVADDKRFRVSPQGYYYWGPFSLLWEYVLSSQEVKKGTALARLENKAWQVAASYVLTGDDASYKGVKPKRPFDPGSGAWGALELAARYSELHVDQDAFPIFADPKKAAREAKAWAVGLNWYLNSNVKFAVDYEHTDFDGGSAKGDREDEKVVLSRLQIAF